MTRYHLHFIPWTIIILLIASCQSGFDVVVETYTVGKADFVHSITETGELEAITSVTISAPSIGWRMGSLKITKLVEDGKHVEEGEILIEFDKTEVQKNIDDANAELEIAKAELRKAMANHQSQIEELMADLEKSKLQHRISQLNLESASFEAEIERKQIELDLENAAIDLERAEEKIENQKSVNREEISKLELKVRQVQNKLDEAEETLTILTVTAPSQGIAIIKKNWMSDEKFQVDDQPWRGMPLIGLPDLSAMKAIVQINEVDIAKIDTTQEAVVRLDAYPDTSFHGRISEIATLARNKERGSKVKVFDATILLDGNSKKLIPGMTVSGEIIVERIPDTLFIPLEALFRQESETFVYQKKGSNFIKQNVSPGQENQDYVIITQGLNIGDEVALTNPMEVQLKKEESKSSKESGETK